MDSKTQDSITPPTEEETQHRSPCPTNTPTVPTVGPRGNILPLKSEKGQDPWLEAVEPDGTSIPHSLRDSHYHLVIDIHDPHGKMTLLRHPNGKCKDETNLGKYSAETAWNTRRAPTTADGKEVRLVRGTPVLHSQLSQAIGVPDATAYHASIVETPVNLTHHFGQSRSNASRAELDAELNRLFSELMATARQEGEREG